MAFVFSFVWGSIALSRLDVLATNDFNWAIFNGLMVEWWDSNAQAERWNFFLRKVFAFFLNSDNEEICTNVVKWRPYNWLACVHNIEFYSCCMRQLFCLSLENPWCCLVWFSSLFPRSQSLSLFSSFVFLQTEGSCVPLAPLLSCWCLQIG